MFNILVINPGSTSTKVALFDDDKLVKSHSIAHAVEDLQVFSKAIDQLDYRLNLILEYLEKEQINITSLSAVIGRGGFLPGVISGVFYVNEEMVNILSNATYGDHVSNLGAIIALEIASMGSKYCQVVISDPVVVDEMSEIAHISGLPEIPRRSVFHVLNHKAVARHHSKIVGKNYDELNLIIAHLGGGTSVGAHHKGKVIDVNQGLNGYGAFAPERAGTLDAGALVKMCYSGKYTEDEVLKKLAGNGGLTAHFGTNDVRELEKNILEGDEKAELVLKAMAYTVSKEIMALFAVFDKEIDAIIITGGVAYSTFITNEIKARVGKYADVFIYPGEDEMQAMALNALRVLRKEEEIKDFIL